LFHDIIGTHVCHHLISSIPFYHAEEASIHIKKVMGKHYKRDDTPFMKAFWKQQKECKFVEECVDDSGVYFFRNLHGVGVPPKDLTDGKDTKDVKTAMASSRNLDAKRRFSGGGHFPATLPLMSE